MDKVIFTRAELYALVWKFPIIQIAKHYEISSAGIKNACSKMKIPLPGSKHWTTLEYKRKTTPRLSMDYTGSTAIGILKKTYEIQLRNTPKSTPLLDLVKSIKSDSDAPLTVPSKLTNPVNIVAKTFEYWKNKAKTNFQDNDILYLNVCEKNMNRALLFMDTFIKLLEHRGHKFEHKEDQTGVVYLFDRIEIDVYLREALKRIPPTPSQDTSTYVYTGDLIFRIIKESNKKEWRDGPILLEENLALIVAKLELMAEEERKWKEDSIFL